MVLPVLRTEKLGISVMGVSSGPIDARWSRDVRLRGWQRHVLQPLSPPRAVEGGVGPTAARHLLELVPQGL